ncbi:Rhs family-like protein [Streptomyces venezuelae]|uniref:Rhs family-like protein n=1 Tax=Streptomyces venezuelae TaxID=54571 RepID=A0A5P2CVI7_STRVZ|nr:polymorphic toxin-type HINT domain-containing protein [Streptomyces venezuelae]QES46916.1 Rhs family-like protein [Streptomyces venezuelae]
MELPGAATPAAPAKGPKSSALTAPAAGPAAGAKAKAGSLPVNLSRGTGADLSRAAGPARAPMAAAAPAADAPLTAKVELKDRKAAKKAGVGNGLLLSVQRTDRAAGTAPVTVELDYKAFRNAYGGSWGSRLRFTALPACSLTTPEKPECRQSTPVVTTNDAATGTLKATVPAAPAAAPTAAAAFAAPQPVVLAAEAGQQGPSGDFKATSLQATGSWTGGGSSGDFNWSYPMEVPASLGGPSPALGLTYSSASVDGRTSASAQQPSWVGDGWDLGASSNFVERAFVPCASDRKEGSGHNNPKNPTGDLCEGPPMLTMSLNGSSTQLVLDGGDKKKNKWRPASDDGSKVDFYSVPVDAAKPDGEKKDYWRITTPQGIKYYFGINRLGGWAEGKEETNSVWRVPVYGNHPGETCHQAAYADSVCDQTWRWNLDAVVDARGNAMTYWYEKETNHYGSNVTELGKSTARKYDRGGWLQRIDYGQRAGEYFTPGAARITFDVAERCLKDQTFDCAESKLTAEASEAVTKKWPDVPADQLCEAGKECKNRFSPTFFTRKRLTAVNTHVLVAGAFKAVDTWTLSQDFKPTGDGAVEGDYPLWLNQIQRTGKNGATDPLPPVTFTGEQLPNRVDNDTDGSPPFLRWRVAVITAESGAKTSVTYAAPECSSKEPKKLPAKPEANTLRCYPVIKEIPDPTDPTGLKKLYSTDWFHKHRVDSIREGDNTKGTSPAKRTVYDYVGTPAWGYDDETENVSDRVRTWSKYRGYERVRTLVGTAPEKRSLVETLYFRGRHGDKDPASPDGKRSVDVIDSEGGKIPDAEQFAGLVRETLYYDGETGALNSTTLTTPMVKGPTATRTREGAAPLEARVRGTASVSSRTMLSDNRGQRRTAVEHEYDDMGLVTRTTDRGDTQKTGDESCTLYEYHVDTAKHLYVQKRVETLTKACDATDISRPADVAGDTLVSFDANGNVTKAESLSGYADGKPAYQLTGTMAFDAYGRPTSATDIYGKTVKTAYTPATGGIPTKITTTNPLGHTSSIEMEPGRSLPLAQVDANGRRQVMAYDGLGRMTKAWSPDRDPATTIPDAQFEYTVAPDAPVVITTKRLLESGKYRVTYDIYDAMMRLRQNQEQALDGARVITDTFYDSRGQIWKENGAYHAAGAPEPHLFQADDNGVPSSTVTEYDGLGRPVATIARAKATETWRTTRSYGGDYVAVDPPAGQTPTLAVTDAQGRKTELRQYKGASPSGAYDKIRYQYERRGMLESVTDQIGNVWSYKYDIRGRVYESTDPDKGTVTTAYDDGNRVLSVTDGRKPAKTIAFAYDDLGRIKATHETSLTGPKLTERTYDSLPGALGMPVASTRFENGNAYTQEVTGYDKEYRPLGSKVTIPASEGKLAGSYLYSNTYTETVGLPATSSHPAVAGLPSERVTTGYHGLDGITTMSISGKQFVTDTDYTPLGDLLRTKVGVLGKQLISTYSFDEQTRRNKSVIHDQQSGTGFNRIGEISTQYDASGNILRVTDAQGADPTPVTTDTQCYQYDHLQRMSDAWTATDNCAAKPGATTKPKVGGPDPYWHAYTFDAAGNRLSETKHDPAGDDAKKVERKYSYAVGLPTANRLEKVDTTGPEGARTESYGYDDVGNTNKRVIQGSTQTLLWDTEGHLDKVTEGTKVTEFLYDAGGNRLIRRDPTGTTLYLPGTEVRADKAGNIVKGTRYYTHPAGPVMVKTVEGGKTTTSYLLSDRNGTATTSVDGTTQAVTRRKFTPFGEERGAKPSMWPNEQGYIGGTKDDSTGLTHIGAREYDPAIGRFISVDPEMNIAVSETMNPYAYGLNSPVTFSDPTGRAVCSEQYLGGPCVPIKLPSAGGNNGGDTGDSGGGGDTGSSGGSGSTTPAPTKPKPSVSAADVEKAKRIAAQKRMDVILQIAKEVAKEVSGWNDIKDCLAGSKMACGMIAVDAALSWGGKAVKLGKALVKAWKMYDKWQGAVAWATKTMKRADDDAAAMARYTEELADHQKQAQAAKDAAAKADEAATTAAQKADSGGSGPSGGGETSSGATCRVNSFTPDTKVVMADGSAKAIKDLKPGDKVKATDPESGKTENKEVAATIIGKGSKNLVEVTIDADGAQGTAKPATITATDGHPFWAPELRRWIKATDLNPGTWLETGAGTRTQVTAVKRWTAQATVHNLTVADIHTYYVIAESTPVLVHNCGESKLKEGEQYIYRVVKGRELDRIKKTRSYEHFPEVGAESKYFSTTPESAAQYAKAAFGEKPEGVYTLTRAVIRSDQIPDHAWIENLSDGGKGMTDTFVLWGDELNAAGRVRIMPSMPVPW